jgi:phage terminase large subunit
MATMTKADVKRLQQGSKVLRQATFRPEDILFKEQLDFINDPAEVKVGLCSRRAGKSYAVAVAMIDCCLNYSDASALYIAQTKTAGIQIIWSPLMMLIDKYNLDCKPNNSTHEIAFKNGSKIIIKGTKDKAEIDSIRGIAPSPRIVVLDEAGHFKPFLQELINEVISPALMDYMGTLIMIGTPNHSCSGTFYDAYHKKKGYQEASVHHWTFFDNSMLPAVKNGVATHQEIFKKKVLDSGRTVDDADVKREYFGLWVKDTESQLFAYDPVLNKIPRIPEGEFEYILGVDTGYVDDCAYVVTAYNKTSPTAYIVSAYSKDFTDVTSIIDEVNLLNTRFGFKRILFDPAAGGKNMMAELFLRHGLRAESASKSEKVSHIALLNDDLKSGRLQLVEDGCGDLIHEWSMLTWDYKADGKKIPGTHIGGVKADHTSDAALYCWRGALHYRAKPEKVSPVSGTDEYTTAEQKEHFKRLQEEAVKRTKHDNMLLMKQLRTRRGRKYV